MSRDMLIVVLVALVIIVLLAQNAPAADPAGVRVRMGAYGASLDYGSETSGSGCCG